MGSLSVHATAHCDRNNGGELFLLSHAVKLAVFLEFSQVVGEDWDGDGAEGVGYRDLGEL